tara:strand:- start:309 stop:926 length:618 start_codon:yes stop_codon:yes gene_type:complete
MDSLREQEEIKYSKIWEFSQYRLHSPGLTYIEEAAKNLGMEEGDHVLDVGCGSGKTSEWLCEKGMFVHGIDIANNALNEVMVDRPNFYFSQECCWQLSQKVTETDWVICTDVLEHLPEKMVHPTLHQLSKKIKKGGFFSICCIPDSFGPKYINQSLHLTVRSARWWADQLGRYWTISWDQPSSSNDVLILVHPRKEKKIEWPKRD